MAAYQTPRQSEQVDDKEGRHATAGEAGKQGGVSRSPNGDEESVHFEDERITRARIGGFRIRAQLLLDPEALTIFSAADLLGLKSEDIDDLRRNRALVALPVGPGVYVYPRWQFERGLVERPSQRKPRGSLRRVLQALQVEDPWMQAVFFITPNLMLGDRTPVEAIQAGEIEAAARAARAYGEQGAA